MITNMRSDHVGDEMNARILITIRAPMLDFCSKDVERLEPVIADTVMKMLSTTESTKLFCHQKMNPPTIPRATYAKTTVCPQPTPFRAVSNQRVSCSSDSLRADGAAATGTGSGIGIDDWAELRRVDTGLTPGDIC